MQTNAQQSFFDLDNAGEKPSVSLRFSLQENKDNFTNVELFAGCGGLALGLEHAGFNSLYLNDFDKDACNSLKKNRPQWNVECDDIAKIAERNMLQELGLIKGELDLLSGGYPCQSFSYAGKRMGVNDTRGTMFYHYAKLLEQFMPKMFLAENVKGLVNHDKGKTLKTMIEVFTDIGYNVQYKVLNAWDYGVGQKRERIVIVGVRNDLDIKYEFPKAHKIKLTLKDILQDCPKSEGAIYPEKKRKVLELVPQGGCWRSLPDDIAKDYMKGSYYLGGGKTGMARRIAWNEPSLTLTCSPSQGQTERCHPDETRPFTVREYARIQSFPDSWEFTGSLHNKYKQIGNAVPVNFAREIGLSIYEALKGEIKMPYLPFISDSDFETHIKETLTTYGGSLKGIDLAEFNKNIIDPIKLTFDSIVFNKDIEQIIVAELVRQRDKTNNNSIGYFHQNIFNYIKNCEVPEHGFDVIYRGNKTIFIELKNKHNTMNSSSSQKTMMRMLNQINKDRTCECYLVEVIAKQSQNIPWCVSLDGEKTVNEKIRRVSIDKFYEIITGDKTAFAKLCAVLPQVITKIVKTDFANRIEPDTVYSELKTQNKDLLKALYLLAFKTYEGF